MNDAGPRPDLTQPFLSVALDLDTVAVIAELKRRSPSKGTLNEVVSAAEQARAFKRGGAAAISILTEPTRFGGSIQDLWDAADATDLPLLKKDFHISVAQLPEAYHSRASAILLIARALPPRDLLAMLGAARVARLETVVEVRTEAELQVAIEGHAAIVGVNSRNLETLEVDERVPERLIPKIPPGILAIWESGVESADDVRRAADCGADAVLVGSALSRATDPETLVRSLTAVPRKRRG